MADMMMGGAPPQDNQGADPQGSGDMPGAPAAKPVNALDHVQASYEKLMQGKQLLGKVRNGLDGLMTLADTVTQDDVIKTAGKLVAAGLTPEGMATLLSEMPEKPEELQAWVSQHDQDVTKREAALNQMADQYRHQLGVEGMKQLVAENRAGAVQPQQADQQSAPPAAGAMGL